ncbi:MFS transporter [Pleurostoma richardsiae]|uniref:MFS transporter n=1 Tax=Pleurostoma richardsiae TaxID=41990 RepID=A0AA38S9Y8_9PEZI|nr:MFS transporter [Pleurostoma richardsiae]
MTNRKGYEPKLPVKQLAILAVARFAEPLALTSVFPYLPEMIRSFGVEENQVAKWAGFTGAIFSISQSFTAVPWGRASDKFGRKPIILLGLLSTMICFIAWGMSTSLPMAITIRAIQGAGNGNVGIIRTVVAEMVPEKSLQPKAFSLMPLVWSIGSVFGPSFGGFFARPAEQYPSLFGNSKLLKTYPFLLPNLMACVIFLISIIVATLFLKETLETKRHTRDWGLLLGEKLAHPFRRHKKRHYRRLSYVDDEAAAPLLTDSGILHAAKHTPAPDPTMREIFTRQVIITITSYFFLALHSVAYDQVLPVFLSYPKQVPDSHNTQLPFRFSGGFGLTSNRIGTIFTIYGIASGIIQFLLFPPLCTKYGALNCFKASTILFPIVYLATPYTALVQSDHLRYASLLFLMLIKGFAVIIGFPCITILLTNSAPSLRILGTLNGFATTFSGIGRASGPAVTGATFSWGVQRGYVIPAWWLLAVIGAMQAVPAWMIVEGDGPAAALEDDEDEDEDDLSAGYSDETAVGDEEEEEEAAATSTAIVAGDAEDVPGVREDLLIPEPEDPDSDVPPLESSKVTRSSVAKAAKGTVRMRRMSASGQVVEHDRDDPRWKAKQGDDEIEG